MSVTVTVEKKQGSTMGTVIAKLEDPGNVVADVLFYIQVVGSAETGPYPPDIVRRPAGGLYQGLYHGVYEKDVVLDTSSNTTVRTVVTRYDGIAVPAAAAQTFGARTPGGASEVRVQDADTPATLVGTGTLSFQGSVVTVENGVAMFTLDSRYAQASHAHPYLPLAGGSMTGRLVVSMNTVNPTYLNGHAELRTTNGSPAVISLHRSGQTAVMLRHAENQALDLLDQGGAWAQYRGGSFWASTNRFSGFDGASLYLDNTSATFVSSYGGALQGRFQSLLLSDSYADAAAVPALGLRAKGGVVAGNLELGRTPYTGTLRNLSGPLHLQYEAGAVAIGNPALLSEKLNVQGGVRLENGSLRTTGQTGWFNETYQGGWYQSDSTWIRSYNDKSIYVGAGNIGGNGRLSLGYGGAVDTAYRAQFNGSVLVAADLRVNGDIRDSLGNAVPAVIVAGTAPATARPGTLWIQV
jgi:hypothetical protein